MKALWLSGGKDSVACLYLHEADLPNIDVIWANTGKYLPEHLAWMKKLRALCPKWHEVRTDRDAQNADQGLPADVVPVRATAFGQQFSGPTKIKVQSYAACCYANISGPLWMKTKELGCDTVICGQREEEGHKAPRRDGDVIDGVTFLHPIEGWTKRDVMDYLGSRIVPPEFYALEHSSLDCFDCTAYLAQSEDRAAYLKKNHPQHHRILVHRLRVLTAALDADLKPMRRILNA